MQSTDPISFEQYKESFLTRDTIQQIDDTLRRRKIFKLSSPNYSEEFEKESLKCYENLVANNLMFTE